MALYILCIFGLYVLHHPVKSAPALNLKKPEIAQLGKSVTFQCEAIGYNINDHHMHWIRQYSDTGPMELIAAFRTGHTTYINDSFKNRVTPSTSGSIGLLKIDNLVHSDTATYYCVRRYYNVLDIWSQGVPLTVTSAEEKAPSLFPLISCDTSLGSILSIGCLARDFLPGTINFSWNDKSNSSFDKGFKTYKPILQSSGTYIASSQIQVTAESWKKPEPYYCTAKHSKNSKTVKLEYLTNIQVSAPLVTMHAPVKDDVSENGNGTIVCVASQYFPNDIKIKWMKNHVATTLNTMTDKANVDVDGKYVISSYITVSKKDWNENAVFSCVVEHSASNTFEIRNLSKSQVCEVPTAPGVIQVAVVPPSFESIYFNKNAPLTCIVSNMLTVDGLDVSWSKSGSEAKLDTKLENPVYQDGSYSATAIATVCPEDWLKESYVCTVKHPDLTSPKKVTLVKENGQEPQTPTLLLFPPHQDELNKKETVTLTCLAKAFSPKDAFFRWTKDNEPIDNRSVVTTQAMEEPYSTGQKSYFMYSTLTLSSFEDWSSGKRYSCLFGHESLPLQIIQRSIDKTIGKAANVNVSLVMSDSC